MEFLKQIDLKKPSSVLKLLGVGLVAVFVLIIAIWLLGFAFRTAFFGFNQGYSEPRYVTNQDYAINGDFAYEETFSSRGISSKSILPPIPPTLGSTGTLAEEFEVTEYYTTIKTRNLDRACSAIEDLKPLDYVIFENTNRYDRGCTYSFKVENERADAILEVIKGLKPETFQENTSTIKPIVDNYTDEVEILEKKLVSVEETLTGAQDAYDSITVLATRVQDVETLAKIIDSKIQLIERLSQERISIKERIDRLNQSKAEQLDRLNFTFFRVTVNEFLIFDFKTIKDSWVFEFQQFVREFNAVVQGVTINLAGFLLQLIQATLYFILALLIIKYGWRFTKRLWKV